MVVVEMPGMQPNQIGLMKTYMFLRHQLWYNIIKEEVPHWTFKKTYLVAFLGHTDHTDATEAT